MITERAGVAASAIVEMHQVRLGMPLECASDELREIIMGVSPSFQHQNTTIGAASDWVSVIVPQVPLCTRNFKVEIWLQAKWKNKVSGYITHIIHL